MTTAEMIALVQTIVDDNRATDEVVAVYLSLAKERMMDRLYPFGRGTQTDIPAEYQSLQCELAARLYLRRGGEGEIVHIENGVHRQQQLSVWSVACLLRRSGRESSRRRQYPADSVF